MNNYIETLKLAKAQGINILTLCIADEVACQFGEDNPEFEKLCDAVYTLYMRTDRMTIASLTWALYQGINEQGGCDKVSLDNVLHYGEDMNTVIEYACSLDF